MTAMARLALLLCLCCGPSLPATAGDPPTSNSALILVKGAAGEEEFEAKFEAWSAQWDKAARSGGAGVIKIGFGATNATTDKDLLFHALEKESKGGPGELWLVLIGHGTFDGKEAKFNLRGPDFSATELAKWLEPLLRPIAIIDTSSASAPFLAKLSHTNRVIVTSTRSGHEQNFSHFGEFISGAIADPSADLDKDGQTSLLEAFLMGSRRLTAFYESDKRLATEHPLLDDNGDGLGTPADWFRGIYAVKRAKEGAELDGFHAHQWHLMKSRDEQQWPVELRARRDQIEQSISALRQAKARMPEDEYYAKLEPLLTDLAVLYEKQAKSSR